jgi:phage terminase small subunit
MPAKKNSALNKRHDTKGDKAAREAAEESLIPKTTLSQKPPSALTGHAHAREVWSRMIKLYDEITGTIITAFDQDLLIKYCLAEEELLQLEEIRKAVFKSWHTHNAWLSKLKPKNENLKVYFEALSQANALLQRFQGMDARLDGKRKMIHSMSQSMYLTPRSRAGVAPEEKEPDEPESEMDKLLNE